ncbi:cytochrome b-domain protein [Trypanosoma rangeli]|uniref:Cytochrome b-domain protein n=1 Tax=Trypanosoma rangeli TaxID=5698 RepID=A0A422N6Z2_TRYRA|nr:cytochrome b-domain protein [Trypanosoma rangeli]RNF01211.1 cytochrome b-domain protein [Trypanosoma rangeli]|eukprot:RNF01211.1 cytochrome b-domain protein [Trypanosoma rangeli]
MTAHVYTREEVSSHATKETGWFIVHGNVCDVSKFYDNHPGGGDVLLHLIGGDATEAFDAVNHSDAAKRRMESLKIGTLKQGDTKGCMRLSEVAERQKHELRKQATACWLAIENKVYDLTSFIDLHPGGRDVLLCESGTDATLAFEKIGHSGGARRMMKSYEVAELHPDDMRTVVAPTASAKHKHSQDPPTNGAWKRDNSLRDFVLGQLQLGLVVLLAIMAVGFALSKL